MNEQQSRKQLMIGFPSPLQGMQNGGIPLSTTSLPWLALVSSVSLMPCHSLDGTVAKLPIYDGMNEDFNLIKRKRKSKLIYLSNFDHPGDLVLR